MTLYDHPLTNPREYDDDPPVWPVLLRVVGLVAAFLCLCVGLGRLERAEAELARAERSTSR
jgi:hypothetical protein